MEYSKEELTEAACQIDSTLHKLRETILTLEAKEQPERYKSQITLAKRRVKAFEIANSLIAEKLPADGEAMTTDELMFFDQLPRFLPVYEKLKKTLTARYPNMTIKVTKTQISFRFRYVFAMISLPYRRKKEWPKEYLMVSFGLSAPKKSPRIAAMVEACPGRCTHHVIVERLDELNAELLGWIDEAYQFSMNK